MQEATDTEMKEIFTSYIAGGKHWLIVADPQEKFVKETLLEMDRLFYRGATPSEFLAGVVPVLETKVLIVAASKARLPAAKFREFVDGLGIVNRNAYWETDRITDDKDIHIWCNGAEVGLLMSMWFYQWIGPLLDRKEKQKGSDFKTV